MNDKTHSAESTGTRNESEDVHDRHPITVCILGASFQTGNLGVSALAAGSVTAALSAYPGARVFFLDYGMEPAMYEVRHPGGTAPVELVNIRFSKKLYLRNNIARLLLRALWAKLLPARYRFHFRAQNDVLESIDRADIIAAISGGDSFSDIYGMRRLVYVGLPQILVLLLGKPLVLLPQTFGPFNGRLAKVFARFILGRASMVYSRDLDGLNVVCALLGDGRDRLEFCYDVGFVLEPYIRKERIPQWLAVRDSKIPLVGLNVSGLLYIGGYTRNNMFGLKSDYRRLVHELIDYFVRTHKTQVMLVPHVFGKGEGGEGDLGACREVYRETAAGLRESLHLIEDEYDQHEIKALIGRCDFFLGSRMHACIAALSQSVPAVGLAYSQKFDGVFSSTGVDNLVIDLRKHDLGSITEFVGSAYRRRSEIRHELETNMPNIRRRVLGLFDMRS
jgi:colanic acid/amylovoran biosynthesis protein